MANTVIALKKSATPTAQPTILANGELAINYADGKLFYKHANGTILSFNTQGGNAFGTINANGTLVVAGSSEAVVTLIPGNNISISADAINDTITIESTGGVGDNFTITTAQIKDLTTENTVVTNVSAFTGTVVDSTIAIAAFEKANNALANTTTTYVGNLTVIGSTTIGNTNSTMNVSGTISISSANVLSQILTDAATINWDASSGQVATVTLTDNRTMAAPTNLRVGTYILHVVQDGTGGRTLAWNAVFKWPAGVAPVLTTTANRRDLFSFVCDGTNLYGSFLPDVR